MRPGRNGKFNSSRHGLAIKGHAEGSKTDDAREAKEGGLPSNTGLYIVCISTVLVLSSFGLSLFGPG
ncbi:hypothetical protein IF2G_02467 [Cordyceps javanica]|nr:hypothetical protein IF2G_02467 [Cordyceps javanica]